VHALAYAGHHFEGDAVWIIEEEGAHDAHVADRAEVRRLCICQPLIPRIEPLIAPREEGDVVSAASGNSKKAKTVFGATVIK